MYPSFVPGSTPAPDEIHNTALTPYAPLERKTPRMNMIDPMHRSSLFSSPISGLRIASKGQEDQTVQEQKRTQKLLLPSSLCRQNRTSRARKMLRGIAPFRNRPPIRPRSNDQTPYTLKLVAVGTPVVRPAVPRPPALPPASLASPTPDGPRHPVMQRPGPRRIVSARCHG